MNRGEFKAKILEGKYKGKFLEIKLGNTPQTTNVRIKGIVKERQPHIQAISLKIEVSIKSQKVLSECYIKYYEL